MKYLKQIICSLVHLFCTSVILAQGGGPPMLTDDPGTVNFKEWEINTSMNAVKTTFWELDMPLVDVNYGVLPNLQLKLEAPFTANFNHPTMFKMGDVVPGIKYRFINQEKNRFLSAALYPQVTITGADKGVLLPLLIEKTIGDWMLGEDVACFFAKNNHNMLSNGNLLGYIFTDKFQIMSEYFLQYSCVQHSTEKIINIGFRYSCNKIFTLIGSVGTELPNRKSFQRENYFAFIGLQSDFK